MFMKNYKNSKNLLLLICLIFLFNFSFVLISDDHLNEHLLNIEIFDNAKINLKQIDKDNLITGSFSGRIIEDTEKKLVNFLVNCDLIGRTYKGRGFSCGFADVEDLKAYCNLKKPNKKQALMIYLECNTTAGFNGDAICKGKSKVLQGYNEFAGIVGFGLVEMPLAKVLLKNNISYPMKINLKLKYPDTLNNLSFTSKN